MGIYFPNAHLQFYSNNFGWHLHSLPFLWLQQPLCIYSREHNVTFVFFRIWLRMLCSCKWIQVLRPAARSGLDINGSGSLHTWSPELSGKANIQCPTLHPSSHLCAHHSQRFVFFSRIALLFDFVYYLQ